MIKQQVYTGGTQSSGRPTAHAGVRIWAHQRAYILSHYPGNTSVLFRYLLEKFINSPEAIKDFDEHLKQTTLQQTTTL